ncbi:MAG: lecithin retinol acyltransferase family protein [Bacilli bacterium]|nr:lecithin retinol acyltransferase family protein [Bacilli bacterium]
MKWEYGVLEKGDHIRVSRNYYYHHGIYLGNNEVIHYTAENNDGIANPSDVKVRKTSLDFFASNSPVEKAIYSRKEKKNRNLVETIISNAFSHLGEGAYNFVNNNCEHFVNKCCYKISPKTQIEGYREKIARIFKK